MMCISIKNGWVVFLILVISSCSSGVSFSGLGESTRFLLRNDSALFRGVHSDMSLMEVKSYENAKLVEEDEDYLNYALKGQPLDGKAEVEYFFAGQDGLDKIISTINIYNEENWQALKKDLLAFYDAKHGKHKETNDGLTMWEFKAPEGQKGTIEMILKSSADKDSYSLMLEITKYYEY